MAAKESSVIHQQPRVMLPLSAARIGPLLGAVEKIERHMNHQAQPDQTRARHKRKNCIHHDRRSGMKRMEADAAAIGVVNRVGEQVIEVYNHRG